MKKIEEPFRVSVYLPGKLYKLMKLEAEKMNRSVSYLVTTVMTNHLTKNK
jgi:hypothetical protein